MRFLRALGTLVLLVVSPCLIGISALSLAILDLFFLFFGKKRVSTAGTPRNDCATVVIPNWNGRDLLEKYLPSVIAALEGNPDNEILVVDNASSDGSAEFLKQNFPSVRVIECKTNLGFGGGSNLGVGEAKNDIVVLLNSDMRVERDFLEPLLELFADPLVFGAACQIFFSDASKRREETGLTQGWWAEGRIRVTHRADETVRDAFPCFYPGGGASAFDRRKFLELGGFDELLRPFYYEDTDLGLMAWKRGWKVLYQPRSIVFHEHRGTIGRKFSRGYIESVLKKNAILFVWKNIHSWRLLDVHWLWLFISSVRTFLLGSAPQTFSFPGLAKAFLQLPALWKARWRARELAAISDKEAFRRPLGTYFRDRFEIQHQRIPDRLSVLFVAPYPIEPPVHGGAVFMRLTLEELRPLADVHLAGMVDVAEQLPGQESLGKICASVHMQVRKPRPRVNPGSLLPHAVREFADEDFAWALHRIAFQNKVDVIQLEYTQLAQYAGEYKHIPCFLFEHDIHFESVRSLLKKRSILGQFQYLFEYLRSLRYELAAVPKVRRIQACSQENAEKLTQFLPVLNDRIDTNLRAGIQTRRFPFVLEGREPDTMLFVGSFRHEPNAEAIRWFVDDVLPRVLAIRPEAKLVIVGSDPPPLMEFLSVHPSVRFTGHVEDIREPLARYSMFVCPILSGSGIRVKLLEAFSAGIPCVSTFLGAEGLARTSGTVCELADDPQGFATAVVRLLSDAQYGRSLAIRARQMMETERDGAVITARLEKSYRREVNTLRAETAEAATVDSGKTMHSVQASGAGD